MTDDDYEEFFESIEEQTEDLCHLHDHITQSSPTST